MQITIHIDDPAKSLLELSSWLRSGGYRLVHRTDGVHAVPIGSFEPKGQVVPLRRQVRNPFEIES